MTNIMSTTSTTEAVLIRRATPADTPGIRTVALLDSKRMPTGPFLVAEVRGDIVAARSISTGAVVADPFRPTSDIVAMLGLRAAQMSELDTRPALRSASSASFEAAALAA